MKHGNCLIYELHLSFQDRYWNCKIIFLTATPIINDPYESVFLLNMLRGKNIYNDDFLLTFDLDKNVFNNTFYKNKTELNNKKKLKKLVNGLISYYPGIDKNLFAEKKLMTKSAYNMQKIGRA